MSLLGWLFGAPPRKYHDDFHCAGCDELMITFRSVNGKTYCSRCADEVEWMNGRKAR